ncbi:MAG: aryl-sulfate sulfotransferase [Chitinophagaceae bacterium]|nr:aryl-sulfate sulfotransferase [Chitinophagaceae bacterium]
MAIRNNLNTVVVTYLKLPGFFWGLVVLLFSCSRKDNDLTVEIKSKQLLQNMIDSGALLNSISEEGSEYVFNFETGILRVPGPEITGIAPKPEQWKTTLTFNDGSQLTVPSKGTSLDFIVEQVQLDPSGYNPLAAIAQLRLPTYGRVRVTVHGKNGTAGTIAHLCKTETIRQDIPVFGLYPGHDNIVDLTFTDKDGRERGTTQIHIRTQALNIQDFPRLHIAAAQTEKMEPGVNLVSYPGMSELDLSMPYMVDSEGEIRWILLWKSSPDLQKLSASIGLKRTKKGTFITGDQSMQRIVEIDMFGNLLHQWDLQKLGYTFHHEVTEADNGNFLITVSKSDARLLNGQPRVNDFIIELDPAGSGSVVKEWDLAAMVDTSRYVKPDGITPPQFSQNPTNWAHNNSIAEIGDDLLATMRYQGIISFSYAGNLRWIISPHKYWSAKYQPWLLNPVDEKGNPVTDPAVIDGDAAADDFDWAWGPHTPVLLPNGHILVFDNGYNRHWISNALPGTNNYSRVVEYKVDETKKTVQQVWAYGRERGAESFSQALSGVQYLPQTGHIMFCPGMGVPAGEGYGGRVIEIDPITKQVIFELEISASSNTAFHRVTRLPLYPGNI